MGVVKFVKELPVADTYVKVTLVPSGTVRDAVVLQLNGRNVLQFNKLEGSTVVKRFTGLTGFLASIGIKANNKGQIVVSSR